MSFISLVSRRKTTLSSLSGLTTAQWKEQDREDKFLSAITAAGPEGLQSTNLWLRFDRSIDHGFTDQTLASLVDSGLITMELNPSTNKKVYVASSLYGLTTAQWKEQDREDKFLSAITAAGPEGLQSTNLWLRFARIGDNSSAGQALASLVDSGLITMELNPSTNKKVYVASSLSGLTTAQWKEQDREDKFLSAITAAGPEGLELISLWTTFDRSIDHGFTDQTLASLVDSGLITMELNPSTNKKVYVASSLYGLTTAQWKEQRQISAIQEFVRRGRAAGVSRAEINAAFKGGSQTNRGIKRLLDLMYQNSQLFFRTRAVDRHIVTTYIDPVFSM